VRGPSPVSIDSIALLTSERGTVRGTRAPSRPVSRSLPIEPTQRTSALAGSAPTHAQIEPEVIPTRDTAAPAKSSTGSKRRRRARGPSAPSEPSPQHTISRALSSPRTAHACSSPKSISRTGPIAVASTGVALVRVVPSPSSPVLLSPQQRGAPSSKSAQLTPDPVAMEATFSRPGTRTGSRESSSSSLCPSVPAELSPQHQTL
jgi:hypothetical protein